MSWTATAWAKKTSGHRSHSTHLVLMVLADYHDTEKGYAWPSQKMLAEDCEMAGRTVRWCLHLLEEQGFITTVQKGNQYQPSHYRLNMALSAADEVNRQPIAPAQPIATARYSEAAMQSTGNPLPLQVKRQSVVSEAAIPVCTSLQEPSVSLLLRCPEWLKEMRTLDVWRQQVTQHQEAALIQWIEESQVNSSCALNAALSLAAKWDGKKNKRVLPTFKMWALGEVKFQAGRNDTGPPVAGVPQVANMQPHPGRKVLS